MRKILAFGVVAVICFTACKKSNSSGKSSGNTFTATVNGQATTFNVNSATLLRSQDAYEKRMDITGTSQDSSKQLTITLGLESPLGSGMTVKSYVLNAFPPDDPSTPDIDESITTEGFTTYGTRQNGSWLYDIYNEDGIFVVTACDSAHTTVSGTFQTTLRDFSTNTVVVTITEGKIDGLKYRVLN